MIRRFVAAGIILGLSSCVGTTGSDLVDFNAYAAGPERADPAVPFTFISGRGWSVSLDRARLHIGAAYLNRAFPTSGAQETSCILPGLYVAAVPGSADIDVLSGVPQPFAVRGEGTADPARAGELWLMGGDVNATDDTTVILDVAGTAVQGGQTIPFEAQVTIGNNRSVPPKDPSLPGSNPICKQRIVSPIPVNLTPRPGGALLVRINPRGWFSNVDFSGLAPAGDPPVYRFVDDDSSPPSVSLFSGLRATVGVYTFDWTNEPP